MTQTQKPPIQLKCPSCQRQVIWNDEFPYRPFCSERCKLIDFSDWATEKNRIPGSEESSNISDQWESSTDD